MDLYWNISLILVCILPCYIWTIIFDVGEPFNTHFMSGLIGKRYTNEYWLNGLWRNYFPEAHEIFYLWFKWKKNNDKSKVSHRSKCFFLHNKCITRMCDLFMRDSIVQCKCKDVKLEHIYIFNGNCAYSKKYSLKIYILAICASVFYKSA